MTVALLLLFLCGDLAAQSSGGERARTLDVGGSGRTYLVHVPASYQPSQPIPLVLVFHAAGGDGRGISRHTGLSDLAEREGFVAAYPDGIGGRWNDGRRPGGRDDVAFVRALLDTLRRELSIDSTRIYVTGISNGAMFSHRLACELPGMLAAIAPVAGAFPAPLVERCAGAAPVSVVAFQGTADRSIPYEGGSGPRGQVLSAEQSAALWAAAAGCGGATEEAPAIDSVADGTRLRRLSHSGCAGNRAVVLYRIDGGGHTWPGGPPDAGRAGRVTREIDASRAIWEFFRLHPRP